MLNQLISWEGKRDGGVVFGRREWTMDELQEVIQLKMIRCLLSLNVRKPQATIKTPLVLYPPTNSNSTNGPNGDLFQ